MGNGKKCRRSGTGCCLITLGTRQRARLPAKTLTFASVNSRWNFGVIHDHSIQLDTVQNMFGRLASSSCRSAIRVNTAPARLISARSDALLTCQNILFSLSSLPTVQIPASVSYSVQNVPTVVADIAIERPGCAGAGLDLLCCDEDDDTTLSHRRSRDRDG